MSRSLWRRHSWWMVEGVAAIGILAGGAALASGAHAQAAPAGKPHAGAVSGTSSSAANAGEGDSRRGRELYVKLACYQCHGYEGQGGTSAGPRLGPDPLPAEAMAAFIRVDNGMMPPYTAKLVPDKDVADVVAYLRTVIKPTDIKNIPDFKK